MLSFLFQLFQSQPYFQLNEFEHLLCYFGFMDQVDYWWEKHWNGSAASMPGRLWIKYSSYESWQFCKHQTLFCLQFLALRDLRRNLSQYHHSSHPILICPQAWWLHGMLLAAKSWSNQELFSRPLSVIEIPKHQTPPTRPKSFIWYSISIIIVSSQWHFLGRHYDIKTPWYNLDLCQHCPAIACICPIIERKCFKVPWLSFLLCPSSLESWLITQRAPWWIIHEQTGNRNVATWNETYHIYLDCGTHCHTCCICF